MTIREEAMENWREIRRHCFMAYSAASLHEDYEAALVMAEWALRDARR